MKKRILLIDESVTVQKVVSLTLGKGAYQVLYARNRQEVIKTVVDNPVDLILLSENIPGLAWQTFPKELESWLGSPNNVPPVALISGQGIKEAKHYMGVLKKPFTPQSLLELTSSLLGSNNDGGDEITNLDTFQQANGDELKETFNRAFADEAALVNQTLAEQSPIEDMPLPRTAAELWQNDVSNERAPQRVPGSPKERTADLWGTHPSPAKLISEEHNMMQQENPLMTTEDSMAYKSALEHEVKSKLQNQDLYPMVKRALDEILPPMVEKLVQERLDALLKEHEESLAS